MRSDWPERERRAESWPPFLSPSLPPSLPVVPPAPPGAGGTTGKEGGKEGDKKGGQLSARRSLSGQSDRIEELKMSVHAELLKELGPELYNAQMDHVELEGRVRQV